MSPEQINQPDQIDQRSDIYSLGATLYELLTGTEPFQGKNSDEIFDSILTKTPLSPQRVRPDISPITCELISKLMHRDRSQRPQNWPEAIAIIDKTLNRYKEDDQHLIHHDQDTLTYCLAEDKKTFTQIILIIILSLSSFISFAYFLVNSFLK
jgi:serine/threonine protein kinase